MQSTFLHGTHLGPTGSAAFWSDSFAVESRLAQKPSRGVRRSIAGLIQDLTNSGLVVVGRDNRIVTT